MHVEGLHACWRRRALALSLVSGGSRADCVLALLYSCNSWVLVWPLLRSCVGAGWVGGWVGGGLGCAAFRFSYAAWPLGPCGAVAWWWACLGLYAAAMSASLCCECYVCQPVL